MRLFLALDMGETVRRKLGEAVARVRAQAPHARWVDPEKLHLTLVFLGNVAPERLAVAAACAEATGTGFAPVAMRVRGGGTFGGRARPRVLWAGIESEHLGALQEDLERRLGEAGFEAEERDFRPHLTLARTADRRGDPGLSRAAALLAGADLGEATPPAILLVESHLSPKGAHYEVRATAPLSR